ncbi:2TM domain-containing protein [Chitinophaga sp. NPDC101104]|uniref:2TM domain-containing protein n=1 Tax=Chitinophaga sp. NPDC101104 TaxID=3390561 RepID=UPI003CFF318B
MDNQQKQDKRLWRIAKARAAFRVHGTVYLFINGFLWLIWFLTSPDTNGTPWPAWPMATWGLLLAFNYYFAFEVDPFRDTLREYEKLQQEKELRGL